MTIQKTALNFAAEQNGLNQIVSLVTAFIFIFAEVIPKVLPKLEKSANLLVLVKKVTRLS